MKIYELQWTSLDEKEWVAANSIIEALQTYCKVTGTDLIDLEETDEIVELPREKWAEHKVINTDYDASDPDDWQEKTFEEWMNENDEPDVIAGTMYV
jgi:hypothetical protein